MRIFSKPLILWSGKKSRKETEKEQLESPGKNNKKKCKEGVVGIKMIGGGPKMAEEQDRETTFSSTNSQKDHWNAEQIPQSNF